MTDPTGRGTLDQLTKEIGARGLPEAPARWVWDPRPGLQLDDPRPATAGSGACPFLQAGARFFEGHAFWGGGTQSVHLFVVAEDGALHWRWIGDGTGR